MSEDAMNEKHVPGQEGVIEELTTAFSESSERITTTVGHGRCSGCGRIDAKTYHLCSQGDLLCPTCLLSHEGTIYCRKHAEIFVGSKSEAKIGIGILVGLDKNKIKKFGAMTEEEVTTAERLLEARNYCSATRLGLFGNSIKLNHAGISAMRTLYLAYRNDSDMIFFFRKLEEVKPDWRETLGVAQPTELLFA